MEVVARCPDCGREHPAAFDRCDWCGGGLRALSELDLGAALVGATLAFRFAVFNPGVRPVHCRVTADEDVNLGDAYLSMSPGGTAVVRGELTVGPGPHGRREFRIVYHTPEPCETVLRVEVEPPRPRLDFHPAAVHLRTVSPGTAVRSSVVLRNSGNVELTADLTTAHKWLAVESRQLTLAPGESAEVKLRAKSKRTDSGLHATLLTATADGDEWSAAVQLALPGPELTAEPVDFGELRPGRRATREVVIRNTGRVRVNGTLEVEAGWLFVSSSKVNLAPGREKTVRVRAVLTDDEDGPQAGELVVTGASGVVLRVPVTAVGKVPRPVLRAVRKQNFRGATGAPIERKFQIANDGDGRLDLTATSDARWLTIETPALKVLPGKKRKLRYTVDLPALPRGAHSATIALTSNGGNAAVPVTVEVLDPNPLLEVLPPPDLGVISPQFPLSVTVQVRNAGIGLMRVKAEGENSRVTVSPRELDVPTGPPARFKLTVPVSGLAGGEYEAAVRFTSNGGAGRAAVRFSLPTEHVDLPSLIDLGVREAGAATGGAVRVRNTGPHPVTLAVRGEQPWLRPGVEQVTIPPRESTSVVFNAEPPAEARGPLTGTLAFAGRAVRHSVAVRLVAKAVELVLEPDAVDLTELNPGAERAFLVSVLNAGEIPAVVGGGYAVGELDVWAGKATVRPGERVTLRCNAKVNATQFGRRVRAEVPLGHGLLLTCEATVSRPLLPRVLAGAVAAGGVFVGAAVSVAVGWWLGVPLGLILMLTGAWLFWRES